MQFQSEYSELFHNPSSAVVQEGLSIIDQGHPGIWWEGGENDKDYNEVREEEDNIDRMMLLVFLNMQFVKLIKATFDAASYSALLLLILVDGILAKGIRSNHLQEPFHRSTAPKYVGAIHYKQRKLLHTSPHPIPSHTQSTYILRCYIPLKTELFQRFLVLLATTSSLQYGATQGNSCNAQDMKQINKQTNK